MAGKIKKGPALYFPPSRNWRGMDFVCGACHMTITGEVPKCTILKPAQVNLERGGCALFSPGDPSPLTSMHKPMRLHPWGEVVYSEDGPFGCKRCEHFNRAGNACAIVEGFIYADGCCSFWEKKTDLMPPPEVTREDDGD